MIINSNDKSHLVLLPKKISKDKFLLQAKVRKGSYFYKKLESVYVSLTSSTTNLEEEYRLYYNEYGTFEEFLYHKYPHLDEMTLDLINNSLSTKQYNFVRGYMYELSDYQLHMFMEYSDEFTEKINNLLKAELYEN